MVIFPIEQIATTPILQRLKIKRIVLFHLHFIIISISLSIGSIVPLLYWLLMFLPWPSKWACIEFGVKWPIWDVLHWPLTIRFSFDLHSALNNTWKQLTTKRKSLSIEIRSFFPPTFLFSNPLFGGILLFFVVGFFVLDYIIWVMLVSPAIHAIRFHTRIHVNGCGR